MFKFFDFSHPDYKDWPYAEGHGELTLSLAILISIPIAVLGLIFACIL